MGQDKATVEVHGMRLVDIVHGRLTGQVNRVITNAPSPLIEGIANVPDIEPDLKGPLAGLLAAFGWAEENIKQPYAIVTVAVDTPFFPDDMVAKLSAGRDACVATHAGEIQPTFGLWPHSGFGALSTYRDTHNRSSIRDFARRYNVRQVAFEGADDFFNINTPEDLTKAQSLFQEIS